MCGILGWAGGQCAAPETRARARAGLLALHNRGPDGARLEGGAEWLFGHTRLAILDLTDHAAQPMRDAQGRWLVFNGEIYNFRELRVELEGKGVRFQSTGDSEVLLHALAHWGIGALTRLRGMFAFGWIDPARRELILARDRYGVKPLAWERTTDGVRFASDLFALDAMAGGARSRTVDAEAARRYLLLGYVPAPRTIWTGVHKLRPGHYLRVRWQAARGAEIEERAYWSLKDVPPAGETADPLAPERFAAGVGEAVGLRLISDVPVGILLSGGIDSSLVAAACVEQSGARIPSFTMGFGDAGSDERPAARATADHLGLAHRDFLAEQVDIADVFADVWHGFDEPFADSSALPMLILCREIRRHVKVAIGGDGGDEVWGGYPWHRALQRAVPWFGLPAPLRRSAGRLLGRLGGSTGYKARVMAANDRLNALAVLKTGLSDDMAQWLPVPGEAPPVSEIFREGAEQVGDIPDPVDWAGRMDLVTYLPDDLMVKADRASMRSGLELREPLLDHEFTIWGLTQPIAQRYNPATGQGKLMARDYLAKRLPAEVLHRPKQGFTPPLREWLAGPLREIQRNAIASLEAGRMAPFTLPDRIGSWAECARRLEDRHNQFLWRIVCFHGWYSNRLA